MMTKSDYAVIADALRWSLLHARSFTPESVAQHKQDVYNIANSLSRANRSPDAFDFEGFVNAAGVGAVQL